MLAQLGGPAAIFVAALMILSFVGAETNMGGGTQDRVVLGVRFLTPHPPIVISDDFNFTAANGVRRGSGSPADPYVISGWDIDASNAPGIRVGYTNASFRIDNVSVHSGGENYSGLVLTRIPYYVPVPGGFGYGPMRGRVTVENTTITDVATGIAAGIPTNATFQFNSISQVHTVGIDVSGALTYIDLSLLISRNRVTQIPSSASALSLYQVQDVTVVGNEFGPSGGGGIVITYATVVRIYHNNLYRIASDAGWNSNTGNDVRWDNGYPSGGNYWSDMGGLDQCQSATQKECSRPDGIWDTAYAKIGGYGGSDRFPLVGAFPDLDLPTISGAPVTSAEPNSPISVSVDLISSHPPTSLVLWYRPVGSTTFESADLNSMGGASYRGVIPAQARTGTLLYFILARDNASGQSRAPQSGVYEVDIKGGFLGGITDSSTLVALLSGVAVLAGALVALVIWRRRRSGRRETPEDMSPREKKEPPENP